MRHGGRNADGDKSATSKQHRQKHLTTSGPTQTKPHQADDNEQMMMRATSVIVLALATLQQCAIVNAFQAPAVPLLRSRSLVSLEMAQRKSVLGGTKVVPAEIDHSPVVPQEDYLSSLSAYQQQQQQGREPLVVDGSATSNSNTKAVVGEENDPTKKMMQQIKDAGLAGVISYALWELGFWTVSIPLTIVGYQQVTGHWPDLNDKDDVAKLSAEAFAFVNFARFAVPLRIGLALSTTPWIQTNIVDKFIKKNDATMTTTTTNGESQPNGGDA